ncbi:MAG: tetratricopeptide repeat protein [Alphaproteobacteria bacterium]|nr:tetratricopeptide repeat protein [Alphaproteobacteria bacterium]
MLRAVLAIEANDPGAATKHLERLIALKPDYPEARLTLGHALLDLGRPDEALRRFREAIGLKPDLAAAHNGLGIAFQRLGQFPAARAALQRAVALRPDYAEAWTNLGNVLWSQGALEGAIAAHREALKFRPDYAIAYANLGTALRAKGLLSEAIAAYREALARAPELAAAHNDLGTALRETGEPAEALAAFDRALALDPANAGAAYNRGVALLDLDHLPEAETALRRAIEQDPGRAAPHYALGNVIRDLGDLPGAVAEFRAAVRCDPGFADAWSNLLFLLPCLPLETDGSLARANREWAVVAQRSALDLPAPANPREPDRRLRVGYVSTEFRQHHFLAEFLPVLRAHDRAQFHITCYADVAAPDADTDRVGRLADSFRNLGGRDLRAQAECIRADEIDILVSLTGYLARDRQLFVNRLAPVQASYVNHITTTGLATIDYRISDPWLDPPTTATAVDPETPVPLASGFSVFAPPDDAPEAAPLPALTNATVTFGCFNNLIKISDQAIALWAAVLARVPGARLLIKARDLSRAPVLSAFRRRLVAGGIDLARCELIGYVEGGSANLGAYSRADIGLDPAPFAGGATTREMLWMGLPVITLAGPTRAARIGASLLARAGLPELVAASPDHYVRIAAGLAADVPALAALRRDLRRRVAASPLVDASTHTRELETAFRRMWRAWCAR